MTQVSKTTLTNYKIALRDGNRTLKQVVAEIAGPPAQVKQTKAGDLPAAPTPKVITEDDRAALLAFPVLFAKVAPVERRVLTDDEVLALHEENQSLKTVETLIKGRRDNIGEYIRNHVDEDAIAKGVDPAKAARDAKGHIITATPGNPTRIPIPETNLEWVLEYREGRKGEADLDGERVLDLYESGKITRQQYLSVTRERRVFDEAKATAACVADPTLLPLLTPLVTYSANGLPGTALNVRKSK